MAKNKIKKKIKKHLKEDIKTFKREAKEDKALLKDLKKNSKSEKIGRVMDEFKAGKLHSGSKRGKKVKSRKQAVAIALSEAQRGNKK